MMKKFSFKKRTLKTGAFAFCLLFLSPLLSEAQYPGQFEDITRVSVQVPLKASSFNLQDVRLLNSPFLANSERNGAWLLSINANRLMHNFRVNAGIRTSARAFGGWEGLDMELRGHSTGHILSGLALMYASTGNEAYRKKGDSLVTALAQVQKALNRNGYLSAFPEYFIDRVIAGEPVWAPWYTLHKLYAGLLDMYLYGGNQQALEVVNKMASWAYGRLSVLTPEQLAVMQKNESGGMNEVFYNLYAVTGNQEHRKLG